MGQEDIVQHEFCGSPLDLVIDDASHLYEPTKASFETLFPMLRPGGIYIIEDWGWAHCKEFQSPDHPYFGGKLALTTLIFELVEATASLQTFIHGMKEALIANMSIFKGFAAVERGEIDSVKLADFKLERYISRYKKEPGLSEISKKILKWR